VGRSLHWSWCI